MVNYFDKKGLSRSRVLYIRREKPPNLQENVFRIVSGASRSLHTLNELISNEQIFKQKDSVNAQNSGVKWSNLKS